MKASDGLREMGDPPSPPSFALRAYDTEQGTLVGLVIFRLATARCMSSTTWPSAGGSRLATTGPKLNSLSSIE